MALAGQLGRLAGQSAVYGLGSLAARVASVLLLPLYTRYLTPTDYGQVELVLALVLAVSVITKLGLINAFFRFFFDNDDLQRRREVFATVMWGLGGLRHRGLPAPDRALRPDRPPALRQRRRRRREPRPHRRPRGLDQRPLRAADRPLPRAAAAGRVLHRDAGQPARDGRLHRRAGRLPRRRRRGAPARQLPRHLGRVRLPRLERARVAVAGLRAQAAAADARLRPADGAGRRGALGRQPHRPADPVQHGGRRRARHLRHLVQDRAGRDAAGAGVPALVAGLRALHPRRRRGAPHVRLGADALRRRHELGGRRARARGAVAGAAADRARLLQRRRGRRPARRRRRVLRGVLRGRDRRRAGQEDAHELAHRADRRGRSRSRPATSSSRPSASPAPAGPRRSPTRR